MADPAFENMSDDEFMSQEWKTEIPDPQEFRPVQELENAQEAMNINAAAPAVAEEEPENVQPVVVDDPADSVDPAPDGLSEVAEEDPAKAEPNPLDSSDDVFEDSSDKTPNQEPIEESEAKGEAEPESKADDKPVTDAKAKAKVDDKVASVDFEAAYNQIMAPFKANGKEIKLENPDEVIQLMQMGANYTKKLQSLQPHLKMVKMLENNGLMDEGKLSFLIDLEKKDPEAIKKLLKDSNIDPMDINTDDESTYQAKNYAPSERETAFDNVLEDVLTTDDGKELVVIVQNEWDKASKDAIFKDPNVLQVLTKQKQSGVYAKIANEVERQQTLGKVPLGTPYINAYFNIGQAMQEQGLLAPPAPNAQNPAPRPQADPTSEVQTRKVVNTGTAPRKPASNEAKANAAAIVSGKPQATSKAKPTYLSMSDEEFEKAEAIGARL